MADTYKGIVALKNGVGDFPPTGRIFTRPKIDRDTILDAEFVVMPSREVEGYTEENGHRIPNQLAGKGYNSWLDSPIVDDIIIDRLERNANAPIADIIDAIFYYHEYDVFKED